MTFKSIPVFIRIADLAEELEMHPSGVEKCIYRHVIEPDGEIKHGRSTQPIFLQSRVAEYISAIRKYKQMDKALA